MAPEHLLQLAAQGRKEAEFKAVAGLLGDLHQRDSREGRRGLKAVPDLFVAYHLEGGTDGLGESFHGQHGLVAQGFQPHVHALGHMHGEPPLCVAGAVGCHTQRPREPVAVEGDSDPVRKDDQRDVVAEGNHLNSSCCGPPFFGCFSSFWISWMNSPMS
jgi:hypothetical protein